MPPGTMEVAYSCKSASCEECHADVNPLGIRLGVHGDCLQKSAQARV